MTTDNQSGPAAVDELDRPLEPLKITCTSYDCPSGMHCYKPHRRMTDEQKGGCRGCGVHVVDWERVHRREMDDEDYTFEMLRTEYIRQHMWELEIDADALRKAVRQGRKGIVAGVRSRLRSSIGKPANGFDGRQTPMAGRVVYYAQHATATCCRQCLEYWHGVPRDEPLDEETLDYLEFLACRFIELRIGNLPANGTSVGGAV